MAGFKDYLPLLRKYLELLKRTLGSDLISMCVFGSVVRNEVSEGSDIDLLLVIKGLPPDIGSRIEAVWDARRALRHTQAYKELRRRGLLTAISEVILTPEEVKNIHQYFSTYVLKV